MADDTSGESQRTTDHETIRGWAEERDGRPARVAETADDNGGGILRIDFSDDESLEDLSWDEFFDIFEENDLAFLYQDESAEGDESYFTKFVARE